MKAALFSKNQRRKAYFVSDFLCKCDKPVAIYIYPKNRRKELIKPEASCSVHYFTYEDMLKTEQWLQINSLAGKNTALILDNPSRYPKITSIKVLALIRLEKMIQAKVIIDIVPFTLDIQYLFQPLSYLGREILGYAHYYAWRENYHELDGQGRVRSSHNFELVAEKLKGVVQIDYPQFLCRDRQTIQFNSTPSELEQYATLRAELFSVEDFSPQPTITRLADFAHAFLSRSDALLNLLSGLSGSTLLYTNLSDSAKKTVAIAKKAGFKNVSGASYQVGTDKQFDNVIYLESPIIKSYFLLDAESRLQDGCKVFHLLGDTKVDQYLYSQLDHELTQINEFTQELYRATHRREAIPQTVSPTNGARSSDRPYQLDLFQFQNHCGVG